jgi:hypothetical protein
MVSAAEQTVTSSIVLFAVENYCRTNYSKDSTKFGQTLEALNICKYLKIPFIFHRKRAASTL